ncbi:hypothetical protein ILYODFUR_038304, partial [Ilyodon furcidens]
MVPARLHCGVKYQVNRDRMSPPTTDLAEEHQASSIDLLTFLSREAEKSCRSAGLSVPQSAYNGSRLAIPVPGTGPLRRRSPPAPLVVHSGPALRPTSSSRRKKWQRAGVPSRSAGEEVVSQPAYVRAAANEPASSSVTALSPRLVAPLPMPSALAPARCSGATPAELEHRLRFTARQIKILRTTGLLYSSPELMERIRQIEMEYETAVRLFYCRPPSPTPSHRSAAAEQPTSGLQSTAAEQLTSGLQSAAAEQPTSGLQSGAAEQSTSGLQSAAAEQPTSGLQSGAAEQPDSRPDTPQPDS